MNELVIMQNEKVVTSSRKVGQVFGKRHGHVMDSIENLITENSDVKEMFFLTEYENDRGRTYPKYLMNRDGFTLLAMGFTGSEALQFKLKYIAAFNQLEKEFTGPRLLTEKEKLIASMKLSLETAEDMEILKGDVELIKYQVSEELTLNHGQQQTLHHEIKKRVESIKGDYEITKRKLYSQIHSHLRRAFAAPKYIFVKRKDYDEAVAWVKSWRPLI